MMFQSLLCFLCLIITEARIQYYSQTINQPLNRSIDYRTINQKSSASYYDDYPFDSVNLEFNFPYYQTIKQIYISPNGALHLQSDTPPCCVYQDDGTVYACSFESPEVFGALGIAACGLESSLGYSNIIAPFLVDLDPTRCNYFDGIFYLDTSIKQSNDQTINELYVRWVNVPLYGTNVFYTFTVILGSDGSIQFDWEDVTDPRPFPTSTTIYGNLYFLPRTFLTGVRPLDFIDQSIYLSINQTIKQSNSTSINAYNHPALNQTINQSNNQMDWNTTRSGVYPRVNAVTSNSSMQFCVFDSNICMYQSINQTINQTNNQLIHFTSPNMNCVTRFNHEYSCIFNMYQSNNQSNNQRITVGATFDSLLLAITCVVPDNQSNNQSNNQTIVSVQLFDQTSNQIIISDSPLILSFTDQSNNQSINQSTFWQDFCTKCGSADQSINQKCSNLIDCAGEYAGKATYDECGVCSGGSSGIAPHSQTDCRGLCSGQSINQTNDQIIQKSNTPLYYNFSYGSDDVSFNQTIKTNLIDCLCSQLEYPPMSSLPKSADLWSHILINQSNNQSYNHTIYGQFVGPLSYWIIYQRFDVRQCPINAVSVPLKNTVSDLDAYQTFILIFTTVLIVLSILAVNQSINRSIIQSIDQSNNQSKHFTTLFKDPFDVNLFVPPIEDPVNVAAVEMVASPDQINQSNDQSNNQSNLQTDNQSINQSNLHVGNHLQVPSNEHHVVPSNEQINNQPSDESVALS